MPKNLLIKTRNEEGILLARAFHLKNPKTPIIVDISAENPCFGKALLDLALVDLKKNKDRKLGVFYPYGADIGEYFRKREIPAWELPMLDEFARQGFGSSVEFRRIARREMKKAKNSNIQDVLFASIFLGDDEPKKALGQVLGSQKKGHNLLSYFVDLVEENQEHFFVEEEKFEGILKITGSKSIKHETAERIWKQKLKPDALNFTHIDTNNNFDFNKT